MNYESELKGRQFIFGFKKADPLHGQMRKGKRLEVKS